MSVGKRLRFEILKRDGFRCSYCGANAADALLHVDHVIPVSQGGPDEPENLITACAACNGGKSNIRLDESRLNNGKTTEAMREHAEQIAAYLDAVQEVEASRKRLVDLCVACWLDGTGTAIHVTLYNDLHPQIRRHGVESVLQAVRATAQKWAADPSFNGLDVIRYFRGVLRCLSTKESA